MSIFIGCKYPGEATQQNHRNEIDCLSMSWGVGLPITRDRLRGGRTVGEPTISLVTVVLPMNKAVPKLFESMCQAENLGDVRISLVTAGSPGVDYAYYTLGGSMVSSLVMDRDRAAPIPSATVGLSFTRLEFRFIPYDRVGTKLGAVQAGWDFFANKPV